MIVSHETASLQSISIIMLKMPMEMNFMLFLTITSTSERRVQLSMEFPLLYHLKIVNGVPIPVVTPSCRRGTRAAFYLVTDGSRNR
jgi:hypothetical protein